MPDLFYNRGTVLAGVSWKAVMSAEFWAIIGVDAALMAA